jgi:hypothetical protein
MGVGLLLIRPPRGMDVTTSGVSAVAFVESMRPIRLPSVADTMGLENTRRESAPHSGHGMPGGASPIGNTVSALPCSSQENS